MKKPMNIYKTNYPKDECASYYGDCELSHTNCDTCNLSENAPQGPGSGSGTPGGSGWN